MSIRKGNRDHLAQLAPALASVPRAAITPPESEDPLVFWTQAEEPALVDLRPFRSGWGPDSPHRRWGKPFDGRPELISELLPAIKDRLIVAGEAVVDDFLDAMRAWWRLFDTMERRGMRKLTTVVDLTGLHGRAAIDEGVSRKKFYYFRSIASTTRLAMRLPDLYWAAPEAKPPDRKLAPDEHVARIWMALKRGWLQSVDRGRRLDRLAHGEAVSGPEDDHLREALEHLRQAQSRAAAAGRTAWTPSDLKDPAAEDSADDSRIWATLSALFPTPHEIRSAFHLYLAGSRWNVQTVLDLKVDVTASIEEATPFLREYPGNDGRYIITGFKSRGKSEPTVVGDWKTDRSPGPIVRSLVTRTWPLRQMLLEELAQAQRTYVEAAAKSVPKEHQNELFKKVQDLANASTSVWLYVHRGKPQALNSNNFAGYSSSDSFLDRLVADINSKLPPENHVANINASDFRDAFVAYAWRATGGSILQLQNELEHKHVKMVQVYLDNTLVNAESARILRTLCTTMFDEFRNRRGLDPTVLARVLRDGAISEEDRLRLEEYRQLRRSRIGVGCRDPKNPPKHIDPDFVPDGESECVKHRCTLCLKHAVIGPESLDGMAMRAEELVWLEASMTVQAFHNGLYSLEKKRTELALLTFDPFRVRERRTYWRERIEDGTHKPLEFSGLSRMRRRAQ